MKLYTNRYSIPKWEKFISAYRVAKYVYKNLEQIKGIRFYYESHLVEIKMNGDRPVTKPIFEKDNF